VIIAVNEFHQCFDSLHVITSSHTSAFS